MTKNELREYATANRSRLEKQKVVLGDIVKILVGHFAGERGVVKGMMVPDNDFVNPYYEVEMECEVPDEYKCRKTLLTPNNVIGGFSSYEFEVIDNRVPMPKFKVGDRMYIRYLNMIGTIDSVMGYNEEKDGIFYHLKVEPKGVASAREEWLAPYAESTVTEERRNCQVEIK